MENGISELWLQDFSDVGADIISVHVEANSPEKAIKLIKELNIKAGIALNPSTPSSAIEPYIENVDLILVMSVEPGYCGQAFHENSIQRVREYREKYPDKIIEVDGGVGPENASLLSEAGANLLVAGSAIFSSPDPIKVIEDMKKG